MTEGKAKIRRFAERTMRAHSEDAEMVNMSLRSRRPITDALARMVSRKVPNDPQGKTFAELIANVIMRRAIKGDLRAIKLIMDCVDGQVPLPRQGEERRDPPAIRVIYDRPKPKNEASPISMVAS